MACTPLHSKQTVADGIHIIQAFEYANAAARTGAAGLLPADIGKVARQLDDDSFWVLINDAPVTWAELAMPGGGAPGTHAISHQDGGSDEINVAGLSGVLADDQPPQAHALGGTKHTADTLANLNSKVSDATLDDSSDSRDPNAHASTHQNGGSDELNVGGLNGLLADAQTPSSHATSHQNGGGDELSIAGLSGLLADDQNPVNHASDHQHGGGDEVATATAAANAIPKADGTGKLDEAWISTITDSRYILVDAGRGSTVTTNLYLRHNQNIPSNLSGAVLPFDATLIAISLSATVAATWTAEIRLAGSLVTGALLASGGAKTASTSALSIDFNAGDEVQFYCNGTNINRPHMIAVFRRR